MTPHSLCNQFIQTASIFYWHSCNKVLRSVIAQRREWWSSTDSFGWHKTPPGTRVTKLRKESSLDSTLHEAYIIWLTHYGIRYFSPLYHNGKAWYLLKATLELQYGRIRYNWHRRLLRTLWWLESRVCIPCHSITSTQPHWYWPAYILLQDLSRNIDKVRAPSQPIAHNWTW